MILDIGFPLSMLIGALGGGCISGCIYWLFWCSGIGNEKGLKISWILGTVLGAILGGLIFWLK
jgi:outer membrane lipoprotein SlyB